MSVVDVMMVESRGAPRINIVDAVMVVTQCTPQSPMGVRGALHDTTVTTSTIMSKAWLQRGI